MHPPTFSGALRQTLATLALVSFSLFGCGAGKAGEASRADYPSAPMTESGSDEGYSYQDVNAGLILSGQISAASSASAPSSRQKSTAFEPRGNLMGAPAPGPTPPSEPTPDGAGQAPLPTSRSKVAPLLIYDAIVTLAVFKAAEGIDAVEKLAVGSGGYLVQRTDSEIKVRVPAAVFDASLQKVTELGDELHREVNVRDVTEEFSDLEIRLQSARAVRTRLEELLHKAENVEDALAVEKELERVAGDIERILGRLKLLSELLSFSTITVRFQARPVDQVGNRVYLPFPWIHQLGLPSLLSL